MDSPLAKLYQACDPMKAATAEQYVDCSDVRGDHAFARQFCNALRDAGNSFVLHLLTGHVGGGKSSELVHLQSELGKGDTKYLVVLMDAKEYVDDYDVTANDVLLAVVSELASTVKERAEIELQDGYLRRKVNEFIRLLGREAEFSSVDIPLWDAKASITLLKENESVRQKVRDALMPVEGTFLQEINLVFEEARAAVRSKGYRDIVLILDNLEKIQRYKGKQTRRESHEALFIDEARKFRGLGCSTVLTVPLTLVRSNPGQLRDAFGEMLMTLPMIKVATRDGEPYPKGIAKLQELLAKRGAMPATIDADAEELLIKYSGGHVRDLFVSLRGATTLCTGNKVTLKDARSSLSQIVSSLNPSSAVWKRLAELERDPNRKLDPADPICVEILGELYALEYINGGGDENFLQHGETWYSVNPLLAGLRSFSSALAAYDAEHPKP